MTRVPLSAMACLGLCGMGSGALAQSMQPIDYSQVTRPVVEITNPELIEYLLFELIIEPMERATRLQVVDLTENGYGPDDVIVVYPTVETFLIPELLPDSVQQIMSTWAPEVEYRIDSGNLPAAALAALIETDADTMKRAENAILFDVVQAVERNYRDLPVGILFERDSVGFTFQLWDYNRSAMQYVPRPMMATDSAVASVVMRLRDIGYVPGGQSTSRSALGRGAGRTASVSQALIGIQSFPNEPTRQLAARMVLLGTYDFDRSGAIDAAREIDAIPCDVWTALDATFPGVLDRFGFVDPATPYLGGLALSISERVRGPAGRRGTACLEGRVPPSTSTDEVTATGQRVPLPESVRGFLASEAAAAIVDGAGPLEPGSASWAAAVRTVLVERFDADNSGSLDRRDEVNDVPCGVWNAVVATHQNLVTDLAFDNDSGYLGDRIGVDPRYRSAAHARLTSCGAVDGGRAPRRIAPVAPSPLEQGQSRTAVGSSPAAALSGIRAWDEEERRQLAARTILRSFFDFDRSGYIDTPRELDAMSCDVWKSLDVAFPGFAERYGFVDAPSSTPYQGSIVFNISDRLKASAARRIAACLSGRPAPPTTVVEGPDGNTLQIPVSLDTFMDTEVAARVARAVAHLEPGSAAWANRVRGVLVDEYDLDGSGRLDSPAEVTEVPCVVWRTVEATYGNSLDGLGFTNAPGPYLGDRIGVDPRRREDAGRRVRECAGAN